MGIRKLLDAGKKLNMTEGKPMRLLMQFAVPLFIGSVFQQVYNMVDSVVVGRFVGNAALAAVGGCGSAFNLIIALITGFSTAASVLLAQAYGNGDKEQIHRSFVTSLGVIMLTGAVLTVLGVVFGGGLLILLGTPEEVLPDARVYLTIVSAGVLATSLYNAMSSCLRAIGDSITPLAALIAASLLNVVLDLLFVVSFGMGVAGVAIATVLSQLLSGVYCYVYGVRHTGLGTAWRKEDNWEVPEQGEQAVQSEKTTGTRRFHGTIHGSWDPAVVSEVFRIGVPSALASAVVIISAMFMQRAVNQFGTDVAAAYTAGNRTEQLFLCLSFAIGQSVGTFCGQNIGAKKYDRVREGMHCGYLINVIYTVVMGTMMFIFAPQIMKLFTTSANVVEIGVPLVRITAVFSPVLGFVFIFQNFLRSASDIAPTIWMSGCEIGARSILSFVFANIAGYFGVWWATPIGWTGSMLIGILRYHSGAWQKKSEAAMDRLNRNVGSTKTGEQSISERSRQHA